MCKQNPARHKLDKSVTKLDWFQEYNVGSTFVKCVSEGLPHSFKEIKEKNFMAISKDAEKVFNKSYIHL